MNKSIDAVLPLIASGRWTVLGQRMAVALLIIAVAFLAARLVGVGLARLRERSSVGRPLIYIVEKLAGYAFVLTGGAVALSTLGVNLTSLAVFAGALGVGVGLGLQGVVRDFVAGLLVIFDPNIQVGDFVELDGVRGIIAEVGPRATRIRTNDGLHVILPNSRLIESQVVNWTFRDGTRRIHVPFSVAYGVDKTRVRDVVLAAAHAVPFTLPDVEARKTQVWLTGFGDSGLQFELVVWPTFDAVKRPSAMQAAYNWAIEDALRAANIEIPYPQTDLRVRSLFGREDKAALQALGLEAKPAGRAPSRKPAESRNDAADELIADAELEAREGEAVRPPIGRSPGGG